MRQDIIDLIITGKTNIEISIICKCSPSLVSVYKRKLGLIRKFDYSLIQKEYDSGLSLRDLSLKYNLSKDTLQNHLITRNIQEANENTRKTKGLFGIASEEYHKSEKRKEALKKCGGYRPRSGSGKGQYVTDSNGNKTYLQSSYEILCSQILNDMNIKWTRPSYINYVIDGVKRKYYPDFYLPDYDLYLDPKNDFLIEKDTKKISLVILQNNVKVIMLSKKQITKEYILFLIG